MIPGGYLSTNYLVCVGGPRVLHGGNRLGVELAARFLTNVTVFVSVGVGTDTEYLPSVGVSACVIIQVPFREHHS